ncbi:MAG TPA: hypothetical protein VLJ76_06290 [Gaiellaceae bacterium]|nr:hypothetical protein [Gaiellaceae bacterium]
MSSPLFLGALAIAILGVSAILLYHSREPDVQRRRTVIPRPSRIHARLRSQPGWLVKGLHAAVAGLGVLGAVFGFEGEKFAGEALIGASVLLGVPVALWLKVVRNAEKENSDARGEPKPEPRTRRYGTERMLR